VSHKAVMWVWGLDLKPAAQKLTLLAFAETANEYGERALLSNEQLGPPSRPGPQARQGATREEAPHSHGVGRPRW
jgi:hypothetical protein